MEQVAGEVQRALPDLASGLRMDRNWLWLVAAKPPKEQREKLKAIGFRFARDGHALETGEVAMWGHSCERPTRFKRRGGGGGAKPAEPEEEQEDPIAAFAALGL